MEFHEVEIISMLKAHTGFECSLDVVPNSDSLPALALTNLNYNGLSKRNLSGKVMGSTSEHRISLICNQLSELNDLVKSVSLLDNTSNDYFQTIKLDFSHREATEVGGSVVRAFYNLTVIKK